MTRLKNIKAWNMLLGFVLLGRGCEGWFFKAGRCRMLWLEFRKR